MILSFFALPVSQLSASAEDAISVGEAIANNTGSATVEGYIVGTTSSGSSYNLDGANGVETNIAIADSSSENQSDKIIPVQLPKGSLRDELNLVANPANKGKKIQITGDLATYFGVPGLKGPTAYTFSDGTAPDPEPEPEPELSTITDARKVANDKPVKIKGTATAAFETGGKTNLFIQDDTAGIIVRAAGITAQPGDEVTVEGTMSDYFGMQQVETSATDVAITTEAKGIPSPQSLKSTDLSKENGEQHEAEFTQFKDITVQSVDSNGNFTAIDDSGEFVIKPNDKSLLEVGKTYELLKGVIDYNYNEYKLVPRSAADVIEKAFSVTANPA